MKRELADWIDEALKKCKMADDNGAILILKCNMMDTEVIVSNTEDNDALQTMVSGLKDGPSTVTETSE